MCDLGQLSTSDHCILTSGRSPEITDLTRHHTGTTPIVDKLVGSGFLAVLRPNVWPIFHMDLLVEPIYGFRYQSGPLTQFALGLSSEGEVVPFWDVIRHKHSIKLSKQHCIPFRIERETRW